MALCSVGPSARKRSIGFMLLVCVAEVDEKRPLWYGQSETVSFDLCWGGLFVPLWSGLVVRRM
jgi:hypothetical protein